MNSNQNKATLWKSCVEQGIFDKVPPEMLYQVQGLFELTINQFNNEGLELGMANQLLLKDFKVQLGKLIGQPLPQKSFEELNTEYNSQFQPKPPSKIEFSMEKDSPLQDLESILKQKSDQRQNEINEFFKEEKGMANFLDAKEMKSKEIKSPFHSESQPVSQIGPITSPSLLCPSLAPMASAPVSRNELEVHRRILENILISQIKIIELLQRK